MFESFLKPPVTFPTLTGDIVTFNSQYAGLPLKSHVVEVVASQSGTGTPSPSNPRSISGWSQINISHSDADTSNPTVYTITIGSTVYGGEYDARTGVLTVTHKLLNLNDIVWAYEADTTHPRFVGNTTGQGLKPVPDNNTVANDLCNRYQICTVTEGYSGVKTNSIAQTTADRLWVWDTNYTDLNSFKASFDTLQVVAELATPQTIQLPSCPIDTLEGVNNIWADTGDTTLQYIKLG